MSYRFLFPLGLFAWLGCTDPSSPSHEDSASDAPAPDTDVSQPKDSADTGSDCGDLCTIPSSASVETVLDVALLSTEVTRTRDNPLRGFMTSYSWNEPANDFPHQLEYFYVPMANVWDENGETFDSGLEPLIAAAAARGHHTVMRVYIDYPGNESGLPAYLADQVSCQTYTDFGGGCSPDYDDPDLVDAMLGLIEALGSRYDGDPRLGFLQVGLLGFWGEWHTWPHDDWFPSPDTQMSLLNAYDAAFQHTHMQIRLPHANALSLRMGFHDDSFAYYTIGDVDWFFVPILESVGAQNRWQEVVIGGELRPELQGWVFDEDYELGTYQQDFDECVQATHVTYLLNYNAFNESNTGYVGAEKERAEAAVLKMGYQFELVGASLSASGLLDGMVEVQISVDISQTGVAPFYYPIMLQLDSDALDAPIVSTEDLKTLLPDDSRTVVFDLGRVSVDVLNQPVRVSLTSDMLLEGQSIAFATETPWDAKDGQTQVAWDMGCQTESGETLLVGQVSGTDSEGCDLFCDVDGQIRACGESAED